MLKKLIVFAALGLSLACLNACVQKTEPVAAAVATAALAAAVKPQFKTTMPWLQAKIWEFQSQPVTNPPRVVSKAVFAGKTVYYMAPVCCDIPSQLFDEEGKLICYPSGGITGRGDGKCASFVVDKPALSTVWQDARPYAPVNAPAKRVVPVLP